MIIQASTILVHPDPIIPFVSCRVEVDWDENGGFSNLGLWFMPEENWNLLLLILRMGELKKMYKLETFAP